MSDLHLTLTYFSAGICLVLIKIFAVAKKLDLIVDYLEKAAAQHHDLHAADYHGLMRRMNELHSKRFATNIARGQK